MHWFMEHWPWAQRLLNLHPCVPVGARGREPSAPKELEAPPLTVVKFALWLPGHALCFWGVVNEHVLANTRFKMVEGRMPWHSTSAAQAEPLCPQGKVHGTSPSMFCKLCHLWPRTRRYCTHLLHRSHRPFGCPSDQWANRH